MPSKRFQMFRIARKALDREAKPKPASRKFLAEGGKPVRVVSIDRNEQRLEEGRKLRAVQRELELDMLKKALKGESKCLNCLLDVKMKRRCWIFMDEERYAQVEQRRIGGRLPHAAQVTMSGKKFHVVCRGCFMVDQRFASKWVATPDQPTEPTDTCATCKKTKPVRLMMSRDECRGCYQKRRYRPDARPYVKAEEIPPRPVSALDALTDEIEQTS